MSAALQPRAQLNFVEYDRVAATGVSLESPLADSENYVSTLTPPRAMSLDSPPDIPTHAVRRQE
ncbi:hypothetical protein E5082_22085 [Streptomyces griseoluteus]|uniref:Uncharacterized protein n=1 Tax=Streptomyces griseoluteus TaxID=29306 RepID=A0A4Z1DDF2_STRGP|nr:hypothetical protein E5082_22085 [Streptomyces griseoluteus]GHE94465.1 hypothetical protein GCM10017776_08350 [Streptomyces griseoluteus]